MAPQHIEITGMDLFIQAMERQEYDFEIQRTDDEILVRFHRLTDDVFQEMEEMHDALANAKGRNPVKRSGRRLVDSRFEISQRY